MSKIIGKSGKEYTRLSAKQRYKFRELLFNAIDDINSFMSAERMLYTDDQIEDLTKLVKEIQSLSNAIDTIMCSSWCDRNNVSLEDPVFKIDNIFVTTEGRGNDD